jgi:predicted DCC family thiol-disulfide oxidoreductase YuxK
MKEKLTLYYDPDCGFCKKSCFFLVSVLRLSHAVIVEVSSDTRAQEIFDQEYSWSLYDPHNKQYYSKSKVFWYLVKASPFSFMFLLSRLPLVLWLGDRIYDVVARSRPKTCTVK